MSGIQQPGDDDIRLMSEALDCAAAGRGLVEPNPMVGAVIARDGREIARGWHRRFGGPHAEIEALQAARRAGAKVRGATLYVTLEPCCHHGKTPPCTDAVIAAGIARVVAAMEDPDTRVAGKGLARLRQAGIEVTVGVCQDRARRLLGPYCKLRRTNRPWVICKWAQTADGFLALPPGQGRWISNERSRAIVHELRGLVDGILVGAATVRRDDPLLTNRGPNPRQPARVILDGSLSTPPDSQLIRTARQVPVIVATTQAGQLGGYERAARLHQAGAELLVLPAGPNPTPATCSLTRVSLPALLDELGRRQWTFLLVEGGPTVLRQFISAALADELIVFCPAQAELGARIDAVAHIDLPRFDLADLAGKLPAPKTRLLGGDVMIEYLLT